MAPPLSSSSRLQNAAKSGSSGTWGFGTPAGGIPGLGAAAPRQSSAGPTSFAQTIGGPSNNSLDMSEFPSLSGNAQSQFQSSSQAAIWQQRPQRSSGSNPNSLLPNASRLNTTSPSHDDIFMSPPQGRSNPLAESGQDDFPPLGRHGDASIDGLNPFRDISRRGPSHSRQNLLTGLAHIDGAEPSPSDRPLSPNAFSGLDNILSSLNRPGPPQPTAEQHPPRIERQAAKSDQIRADHMFPTVDGSPKHTRALAAEKSDERKSYGIAGLVAELKSDDPVLTGLARGQDLSHIGLNLASPDPLWPTWTGPFPESASRPLQPDFALPDCYTVTNIHRVRDKLPGFSDETLFWIFYTQPMDILQDVAAAELTSRNWRYHKQLQMWLTKDPTLPEPRRITDDMETGSYIFWNQREWARVRQTDFTLEYALLAPTNLRTAGGAGARPPITGL